jgi:hypothetical protein
MRKNDADARPHRLKELRQEGNAATLREIK